MEKSSYELFSNSEFQANFQNIAKPIIIADNLRTPENMGAVLRLAGNIGAKKTVFISDVADSFKSYKIKKTASGAVDKVDWEIISFDKIEQEIPKGYQLVALETTPNAVNITDFTFPEKVIFVIGNEVNGIRNELLQRTDHKVFIPVPGNISSLNVTHALSIALFEWMRQMTAKK